MELNHRPVPFFSVRNRSFAELLNQIGAQGWIWTTDPRLITAGALTIARIQAGISVPFARLFHLLASCGILEHILSYLALNQLSY